MAIMATIVKIMFLKEHANDVIRFKSKRLPVGVVERFRACFSM